MKNFVQYVDSTFAVKVKILTYGPDDGYFVVSGINDDFFILSVFRDNKRVQGVDFLNVDNLFQLSVINDLNDVDLNVISRNYFFSPLMEVHLAIPDSNSVQNVNIVSNAVAVADKFYPFFETPLFRKNIYGMTAQVNHPTIVQTTIMIEPEGNHYFTNAVYDGYHGTGVDLYGNGSSNVYTVDKCMIVGRNYFKISHTNKIYRMGLKILLRIYTDYRTNEIYLSMFCPLTGENWDFGFSDMQWLDGGFDISSPVWEIGIQCRNKFF